ncbi:MAG: succinate--CoA ligase subunit alpha [Elusimicrobia bacterium]|nr:succinate--CoA ligase subunit alpha [Elusimicrobiota bacterium]
MAILADKNTRVLIQGITGKAGAFHAELSQKAGTRLVAGVSPGKGGQRFLNVPVFETVETAVKEAGPIDASVLFVPAAGTFEAVCEAAEAGIGLVVVITEGVPVRDMISAKKFIAGKPVTVIGPNCPGILVPGEARLGIIPPNVAPPGSIGIVSRSGTLTYEAAHQIAMAGLGVSSVVGIGGDPVPGTDFSRILALFDQDTKTEAILMIGEIGGSMEEDAANFWSTTLKKRKPLFAFIAGKTAPKGKRMGHAGAIMEGSRDSAAAKSEAMRGLGVTVIDDLTLIGKTVEERMKCKV